MRRSGWANDPSGPTTGSVFKLKNQPDWTKLNLNEPSSPNTPPATYSLSPPPPPSGPSDSSAGYHRGVGNGGGGSGGGGGGGYKALDPKTASVGQYGPWDPLDLRMMSDRQLQEELVRRSAEEGGREGGFVLLTDGLLVVAYGLSITVIVSMFVAPQRLIDALVKVRERELNAMNKSI